MYLCRIYRRDDEDPQSEHVSVDLVGEATVNAVSETLAAAMAWYGTIGRKRRDRLARIGAPAHVQLAEADFRSILTSLDVAPIWLGECYSLDNGAECWYILVEELAPATK